MFTASCEDDDTPNYETPNYLLGKWEVRQMGQMSASNIVTYGPVMQPGVCELDNVVFQADQTYTETSFNASGDACTSESTQGSYELVGRDLTLTLADGENTATVIALTYETMELSTTDDSGNLVFLKLRKAN